MKVLRLLREGGRDRADQQALHAAQADVWAHLGVALQSQDRLHEALASYGRAVALNPGMHACFANLAALHNYLANTDMARKYIDKALALRPDSEPYRKIREQLEPPVGCGPEVYIYIYIYIHTYIHIIMIIVIMMIIRMIVNTL